MAQIVVYGVGDGKYTSVDRFDTVDFREVEMIVNRYPNQTVNNIGFGTHIICVFLRAPKRKKK